MVRFMKKIILIGLIFFTICPSIIAQTSANDWIEYDQTYYRFYTDEVGLHRVGYNALVGAGLTNPVGSQLQVFARGEEVPIHVTTNGTFGPGDYIEFYGEKNDGYFDTQLYESPDHQSHAFESLFTDEGAYFVSVNPGGNNLRLNQQVNNTNGVPPAEQFFIHESTNIAFNVHHRGKPKTEVGGAKSWFADFELGEGYTAPQVTQFNPITKTGGPKFMRTSTKNQFAGSGLDAEVELSIVGLDGAVGAYLDQHCKVYVNDFANQNPTATTAYVDDQFTEYEIRDYIFDVPMNTLGAVATDITMEAINGIDGVYPYESKFAATYATIRYPHTWDLENKRNFTFNVDVNTSKYIEITNFNGGNSAVIIDLTAGHRWEVQNSGNNLYKVHIPYDPAHPGKREFYISSTTSSQVTQPTASDFKVRNFTDYSLPANQGNYIMVYHDQLTTGPVDQVEEYRKYRQQGEFTSSGNSSPTGTYNVVKVNIDELYDQFAHGIQKHPLSIKNFVNFVKSGPQGWPTNPQHLLLLGKGIGYNDFRSDQTNFDGCLIPTYGHQPSDVELTTPNIVDYRPQIGTGRIPARTSEHVRIYLKKLIEYEQVFLDAQFNCTIEARQKMKDVLLVTKGWGQGETDQFYQFTAGYKQQVQVNNTGWNVVDDILEISDHSPGSVNPAYSQSINDGVAMILYNGHSHGQYWEFNGHFDEGPTTLAPSNFSNQGCYPFVLSNSCFVGQIHRPGNQSQAEDYTLYEDGGSIGFLATLALAYPAFLDIFSSQFVQNVTSDNYGETIGQIIRQTINDVYVPNNTGVKVTCLEFTFSGDPAIQVYNFDKPEYILDEVTHTGTNGGMATLKLDVFNMGRGIPGQQLPIQITSTSPSGTVVTHPIQNQFAPAYFNSYFIEVPIGNEAGSFDFDVMLDPNSNIDEDCDNLNNNFFSSSGNSQGNCPGNAPLPFTASSLVGGNDFCVGDFVFYSIEGNLNGQADYTWTFGAGASPSTATGAGPHLVSYSTGGSKLASLNVDYNDGCGPVSSPAVTTQINTGLNIPTGISCSDQGNMTNVSWLGVAGASSYEVFVNGVSQGSTSSTSFQVASGSNLTIGIVASGANGNCNSPSASYTCADCVPATVQFQGVANNQSVCNSVETLNLAATPAGGTFSGNGVNGNTFSPSSLSPGSYEISYQHDGQGCPTSSSINILVTASPNAVSDISCSALGTTGNVVFNWSAVPGAGAYEIIYNGQVQPSSTGTSFTTPITGNNTIEVSVLSFDQSCSSAVASYVCEECIAANVAIQGITENQAFCVTSSPQTLSATPAGGTWSGSGITDGIFYPSTVSNGSYTLSYTVGAGSACASSQSVTVEVTEAVVPVISGAFTVCPDSGPQTYSTTAGVGAIGVSYNWTVSGNGTIVSGAGTNEITVDWGSSTNGTVSLSTQDNGGCSASSTQSIFADTDNVPQAAFSVNASSLCVGNNFTFQNGTANGTSYQWTLFNLLTQETQSFNEENPAVVITDPGTYNLTLNAFGCGSDQLTQTFDVTEASAEISSESGANYCVGDQVNLFSVNTSGTFSWTGPSIVSGTNGSAITVAPSGNSETYTLTYTDDNGCTDERSFDLSLLSSGSPTASFSALSTTACLGDSYEIVNNSENATSFNWSINNTTTGTSFTSAEFSPVINFTEIGTYDVQLTINGCSGSDVETLASFVTVSEAPTLDISSSANSVCPGGEVSLSLISNGSDFVWTSNVVGSLNETAGGTVTANVDGVTTFFVTATNTAGCPSTSSITIDTDPALCQGADEDCNDGIQNGNESGIDCGGPDCAACPTCDDAIQNGLETGVDCGGPDCADCPSCADGVQNGQETGVDCGGPTCPPCNVDPTCNDGIQNGDETGIDCGGTECAPCFTGTCDIEIVTDIECNPSDGSYTLFITAIGGAPDVDESSNYTLTGSGFNTAIQLAVEEVVEFTFDNGTPVSFQVSDSGGCSAEYVNSEILCPSCDDGIQNGTETGVDCGPDCEACDSCTDGIQNGDEEGIDCGGSCEPCLRNIPNVITPNGDSFNDNWEIGFLLDFPDNNVKIFSRWGSLLIEYDGYFNQFEGVVDGEELPKGTYYYLIDTGGDTEVMNGTLTILR